METLLSITPPVEIRSFNQALEHEAIRHARTCYDHLAGSLGIQLTDSLLRAGILSEVDHQFTVTDKGEGFFKAFQIDLERVKKTPLLYAPMLGLERKTSSPCRGAGPCAVGKAIGIRLGTTRAKTRAIKITPEGKKGLNETFHIDIE